METRTLRVPKSTPATMAINESYPQNRKRIRSLFILGLAIVSAGAVFTQKMFFVERATGGRGVGMELRCEIRHFRDRFQNDGVLRSFGRGRAPRERSMIGDENGGDFARIDILKEAGDGVPGVFFIGGGDFFVAHGIGDWHRAAKIVAMRGTEAGNCLARLGPSGGVLGMRVTDTADFREGFV